MSEICILSLLGGPGESRLPHPALQPAFPSRAALITLGCLGWVQQGRLGTDSQLVMSARAGE